MSLFRVGWLILMGVLLPGMAIAHDPFASYRSQIGPIPRDEPGLPSAGGPIQLSAATTVLPLGHTSFATPAADPISDVCCDAAAVGAPMISCDSSAPRVFNVFYGYDAWRGVADGAWTNSGLHAGANLGARLGDFSDATGIGLQVGGSVGVYDWAGTDYRLDNQNKPTTQGLLTYGLFRRADRQSNWTAAVGQDWMLNSNYSVFGEDSVMWQWRGQLGYVLDDANEWGLWGAWRGHGETQRVPSFGHVTWRPISQLHLYWHHKWSPGGADTWIMFGVPEQDRLSGGGSLGDYIAGAYSQCPLDDHWMLYSMINYMHQSARPGDPGAKEEAWNFVLGVAFYPLPLARSRTVRGHRWSPLLPLANNGLFLVDASHNY